MACVLTAAVIRDGRATIGHVGDTRLYKLRGGRLEKVTRDHSPVGEREDGNEISEAQAMRHPRRNEVYRDVGSEPHAPDDLDFVDIDEIDVEPDAALLICSDGLTDLVSSASIARIVSAHAGNPSVVVEALIAEANAEGGKDNVTAIYVEGPDSRRRRCRDDGRRARPFLPPLTAVASAVATFTLLQPGDTAALRRAASAAHPRSRTRPSESVPGDSITAAIERARPGSQVIVEPGRYREQIRLRSDIRVVSRIPRGATIRLPVSATEVDPAVVASEITNAELVGFRIVGDAATPLGVGLFATDATVAIHDVEISGATRVAVDLSRGARASVVGSDVHDNPGAGLSVRAGASPRVTHSAFVQERHIDPAAGTSVVIEPGAGLSSTEMSSQGLAPKSRPPARASAGSRAGQLVHPRLRGRNGPCARPPGRADRAMDRLSTRSVRTRSNTRSAAAAWPSCSLRDDTRTGASAGAEARSRGPRPRSAGDSRSGASRRAPAEAVLGDQQPGAAASTSTACDGGYFYVAMEYLDGENLSDAIARGPMSAEQALGLPLSCAASSKTRTASSPKRASGSSARCCMAISSRATSGLTPAGHVKVLDFGIAKALSLSRKVTRNDFGSVAYLSPERLESGDVDRHADLWALGVHRSTSC